jgi:hypothetical protein
MISMTRPLALEAEGQTGIFVELWSGQDGKDGILVAVWIVGVVGAALR